MMATTHVFTAVTVATVVAALVPEFATVVVGAAMAGGLAPDLDLYAAHRKTLHFPVYYSVCALAAGVLAVLVPTAHSVAIAVFLLAAAVHSIQDVFGGGLEPKPWLGTSQQAVYDHYHGRWIHPRRWIRYDGAPEDFLLGAALALPGLVRFDGIVRDVLVVLLVISFVYTVLRKRLVLVAERFVEWAPDEVVDRIPERFLPVESASSEQPRPSE